MEGTLAAPHDGDPWADGPRGILISASAGSGKTYQLVHHYLGILYDALLAPGRPRQPLVVDRVLTATFTRAAAAEIAGRLLRRLAEAVTCEKSRGDLGRELGAAELSQEDCGHLLAALAGRLHRLRVCTLDSFLVRSAQAFSAELGLPEAWSILDDPADKSACLEAVDQMLAHKAADADDAGRMLELLLMLNQGKLTLQVRQRLTDHLMNVRGAFDAGPAAAWEVIAPRDQDLLDDRELGRIADALLSDQTGLVPSTKQAGLNMTWFRATTTAGKSVQNRDWEKLISSTLIKALSLPTPVFSRRPFAPALLALLLPLRRHAAAALVSALRDRNRSTRELLAEFAGRYRQVKQRRSAFRFDDFTTMLLDAGVAEHLADFYYRMDGQIDHVLLDEFQDTSVPQWKLLQPMVDELMAGEGGGASRRSFFCVGDVKQTLYGWRHAEPRLLGELARRWPALRKRDLLVSRRSCRVIIETVNRVFGALARNPALQADAGHEYRAGATADWEGWFAEHDTAIVNVPGFCRLLACAAGENAAELKARAVALAAERVERLHGAAPEASIAVLARRRGFIAPLLARLRRRGILASGEGGSPLADDMAVCTVLSLLHLLDHPSDSAAQFHVGSSPLGAALGIEPPAPDDDPEARRQRRGALLSRLRELRAEVLDRGLGAAINRWTGLCAAGCDARNLRRLRQLVTQAHGFDPEAGGFGRFIDTVRAVNVEDSEASAVSVMTIHAAKGRQFDYVILIDLDRQFIRFGSDVLLNRPHLLDPADCITTCPSKAQVLADERLAALDGEWKRRQVVEELCALYVAMTRARLGMEMIVHPAPTGDKFPGSAAGVLRGALAAGAADPDAELWRHEQSIDPAAPLLSAPSPSPGTPGEGNPLADPGLAASCPLSRYSGGGLGRRFPSGTPPSEPPPLPSPGVPGEGDGVPSTPDEALSVVPLPRAQDDGLKPTASFSEQRSGPPLTLRITPAAGASRLRPVIAPSGLEGAGFINLSNILSFAQSRGLDWGTVMHRWFEMIDWLDEPPPAEADLLQSAAALDVAIAARQLETMLRRFKEACAAGAIRRLLSRSSYLEGAPAGAVVEAWRERPFAVPMDLPGLPGGAIVRGQIDRVAVVRTAAGQPIAAEVVDYKTDNLDGVGAADERVSFYAPQVRTYRTAVARLLGLQESAVTAKLAFLGTGRVVEVTSP